jgi:hypothetical protein
MTIENDQLTSPDTNRLEPRIPAAKRRLESGMLWSAIGLAGALVMLLVLGTAGALPDAAVKVCGTILIYLSASLMLLAAAYAAKGMASR